MLPARYLPEPLRCVAWQSTIANDLVVSPQLWFRLRTAESDNALSIFSRFNVENDIFHISNLF